MSRSLYALTLLALLAACGDDDPAPDPVAVQGIQAVNASRTALDVLFDGVLLRSDVAVGELVTMPADAALGPHVVRFRDDGTDSADVTVTIAPGVVSAAIVRSTIEGDLFAFELSDTGSAPVAGRSKVSVVHLAENAPSLDVWRRQPDYPDSIRVMFPFPLGAQSNYMESTPGSWTVYATAEGTEAPRLAATGAFDVGDGEVYVVMLLDEPDGGFKAVTVRER